MILNEFLSLRRKIIEKDFKSLNDMQKKAHEKLLNTVAKMLKKLETELLQLIKGHL